MSRKSKALKAVKKPTGKGEPKPSDTGPFDAMVINHVQPYNLQPTKQSWYYTERKGVTVVVDGVRFPNKEIGVRSFFLPAKTLRRYIHAK